MRPGPTNRAGFHAASITSPAPGSATQRPLGGRPPPPPCARGPALGHRPPRSQPIEGGGIGRPRAGDDSPCLLVFHGGGLQPRAYVVPAQVDAPHQHLGGGGRGGGQAGAWPRGAGGGEGAGRAGALAAHLPLGGGAATAEPRGRRLAPQPLYARCMHACMHAGRGGSHQRLGPAAAVPLDCRAPHPSLCARGAPAP
jgi:hypothetical protein